MITRQLWKMRPTNFALQTYKPDEIFICDAKTLQAITSESTQAVILMSAFLGKTRLIDNQVLDLVTENKEEVKEETAE